MEKEAVVERIRAIVHDEFDRKRAEGRLSLVHDIDHVEAVGTYAPVLARFFASRAGIPEQHMEDIEFDAAVAGWAHDLVREATETEPHGPAGGKKFLELYKTDDVLRQIPEIDFYLMLKVIENHELNFADTVEMYGSDRFALAVAEAICVADKVLEASGHRVLERRAFFAGKERMKKDLTMFQYPEESFLSVLGESLIRLYQKSRADTYPGEIRPLVDMLHATQYDFVTGLLARAGMSEAEAADFFLKKGFPKFTDELAKRVAEEQHLGGQFFSEAEYPRIAGAIKEAGDSREGSSPSDRAVSSDVFVRYFAESETPTSAVRRYESDGNLTGLEWFGSWMDGVLAYRSGAFRERFAKLIPR